MYTNINNQVIFFDFDLGKIFRAGFYVLVLKAEICNMIAIKNNIDLKSKNF